MFVDFRYNNIHNLILISVPLSLRMPEKPLSFTVQVRYSLSCQVKPVVLFSQNPTRVREHIDGNGQEKLFRET